MTRPVGDGAQLRIVIALGGNAILRRGDDGRILTQIRRADEAMARVAALASAGHELVVTHGNGPIVGNIVLRGESARDTIPPMPLYIADADSEGGIGEMLQMSLHNALLAAGVRRDVVTVVTQVVVDGGDSAFGRPTKPIGPFYDAARLAAIRAVEPDWSFVEIPGSGWRRVVASPTPLRVVEAEPILALVRAGDLVIAAGGGGVPVVEDAGGMLAGIDAVVDKDRASALLAEQVEADLLLILMEADRVYLDWGAPGQRGMGRMTADEADSLVRSGALDEGSIGPKVAASARFARATGRGAIICRAEDLDAALSGRAGTRIEAR